MAKSNDDVILPSAAEGDGFYLNTSSPVLEMEDEGEGDEIKVEDGFGPPPVDEDETPAPISAAPTIEITTGEYKRLIAFLEHYGIDTDGMTAEEAYDKYEKIQGLAEEQAQVLSRGATLDGFERLLGHVPKGFKGEFFHDSSTEMDRARALGWVPLKSEEANQESMTGKADGLVRLGDLVLFVIPDVDYAAKQIARERRHADRRNRRKKALNQPSQGSHGVDPMGSKLGAHPDHPIRPLSELRG
jgi:hypothetical protein